MTILRGVRVILVGKFSLVLKTRSADTLKSSFCQTQQLLLCSLNQYINEPKQYYSLKLKYRIDNNSILL